MPSSKVYGKSAARKKSQLKEKEDGLSHHSVNSSSSDSVECEEVWKCDRPFLDRERKWSCMLP